MPITSHRFDGRRHAGPARPVTPIVEPQERGVTPTPSRLHASLARPGARIAAAVLVLVASVGLLASPISASELPVVTRTGNATTAVGTPVEDFASFSAQSPDEFDAITSIQRTSGPSNGSITFQNAIYAGVAWYFYTYAPNPGFAGADSFQLTVTDDIGDVMVHTVTITVTSNAAPAAVADTYSVAEDTTLSVAATGVLANDTDLDGDDLTAVLVDGPSHATGFELEDDGSFTYRPIADVDGIDSFTYRADDGSESSAPVRVTLTIDPVPDDPTVTGTHPTVAEDSFTAPIQLSSSDPDGSSLAAPTRITDPAHGTITWEASEVGGSYHYSYQPDPNFNGADSFQVEVTDGNGGRTVHTETITITPTNDAPTANDETLDVNQDAWITDAVSGSDIDGDTLTFALDRRPMFGTVSDFDSATGAFTYIPDPGMSGVTWFSFVVTDGHDAWAVGYVNLVIKGAPVAPDLVVTIAEDSPAYPVFLNVLTTDPDNANDELTYTIVTPPARGQVSGVLDPVTGSVEYTADPDVNGVDSYTYQACDPGGLCDTGTITVNITPINDAPVADDGVETTAEDTELVGAATATDVDGDELTYRAIAGPSHGPLHLDDDGTYTYTPNADWHGDESFTYQVCDAGGLCDTGTITVHVVPVNDGPVAADGIGTIAEDTMLAGAASATDVDGDELGYRVVSLPARGTLGLDEDGSYRYVPDDDLHGLDSFTYEVCDPDAVCDTATVAVTVTPVNDAPVAADGIETTTEETELVAAASASDVDGDELTHRVVAPPGGGTLTLDEDGSYRYVPDDDLHGVDGFTYEVCDPELLCDTATVMMRITPVNDAPIAADSTETTDEDTELSATTSTTDVDGDELTHRVVTDPGHGTVALDEDGAYTYAPDADWHGDDRFTYEVCDPELVCDTAVVVVTVIPVNDRPWADGTSLTVVEDTSGKVTVPAGDRDDTTLTATVVEGPAHGTAAVDGLTVTYTPDPDHHGTDGVVVDVCDPGGLCTTARTEVTVTPVNDAPEADARVGFDGPVLVGSEVVLDGTASTDVDGDPLTHRWAQVDGPSLALAAPGEAGSSDPATTAFTPHEPGAYAVALTVCDPNQRCSTDTVVVGAEAGPVAARPVTGGVLAYTGANTGPLAAVAAALVTAGLALTAVARTRRAARR
jgi:VCBS repeat-containing protein